MPAAPTADAPTAADAAAAALLGSLDRPDPYPAYARLRAVAPVYVPPTGPILLTSYAAVDAVLRAPQAGKDADARFRMIGMADWREHPGLRLMFTSILQLDGAEHARLRALVSKVFTPRRVETLRPAVQRIARGLIDGLREQDDVVDLVAGWALPLPIAVIGDLLGVPAADLDGFAERTAAFGLSLEPALGAEDLARADTAAQELIDYFTALTAERRRSPREDLTSALAALPDLGDDQLITMLALLFAAGFETTTQVLAKSVLALTRHPDQLERWRADPALTRTAIEELLRFDSPVQLNSRVLRADVDCAGTVLPAGRVVFNFLGAANRDPERFADPDALDLGRPDVRSMSFGGGPHFCLGAALARIEAAEALPMLFDAFDVEPVGDPVPRRGLALHGFAAVPAGLHARR